MHNFKIVLSQPEIPGNTGSIGRTCVGLDIELILIRPYGFDISEKAVRRAGLDYWKYLRLKEYDNWESFCEGEKVASDDLFFFSRFAKKNYFQASFTPSGYLVFGCETAGLPAFLNEKYPENFYSLPLYSGKIRSLNLANCVTAVAYEALRQFSVNS